MLQVGTLHQFAKGLRQYQAATVTRAFANFVHVGDLTLGPLYKKPVNLMNNTVILVELATLIPRHYSGQGQRLAGGAAQLDPGSSKHGLSITGLAPPCL